MSSSHVRNLRLGLEIRSANVPAETPCNRCFFDGLACYIMPDAPKRMKCAECTKAGKPCVNMSWESLDRTREEYRKKVEDDETLLATVIARLLRNKKILKQAEERARHKALGLANEMIESGELDLAEEVVDCPAASIGMCTSPITWGAMGLIEESVANHGTRAPIGGS